MAVLVPEGFALASLANDAERDVVQALLRGLNDAWLVLPSVGLRTADRDRELDVVLVHQQFGVIDLEVKAHRVVIERGEWCFGARRQRFDVPPPEQAKGNAYALRDLLRTHLPHLPHLQVNWAIALPNTERVDGALPPDVVADQLVLAPDLDDPTAAIEVIGTLGYTTYDLTADDVARIVDVLRPDAEFVWDPNARMARARQVLDDLCDTQVRILAELDVNPRVLATGDAGTGKTRLAVRWTRNAVTRQERVLLTCYNEPLAERLAAILQPDDTLQVGPFLRWALARPGLPELAPPPAGDAAAEFAWWSTAVPAHLATHWDQVTERFDTIVVDEAQDFAPEWLDLLERLLDPDGANRLLLVADAKQAIYSRGFEPPPVGDGWTHCRLITNCRNAREIATLLRRKLGGGAAPGAGPDATDLRYVAVDADASAASSATRAEIDRLLAEERDPAELLVLTVSSALRDRLLADLGLVRWEQRPTGIVCENVHRLKGLEADTVILVADTPEVPDHLLYVGISRAVNELVVIAPTGVGARLGLG